VNRDCLISSILYIYIYKHTNIHIHVEELVAVPVKRASRVNRRAIEL